MRFWRRRDRQNNDFGIMVGQRYRLVDHPRVAWEVEAVVRYPGEIGPHVRLRRVGMPNEGKTIALHVLRDRRFYQPAP